jgi:hypothetical protein
MLPIDEAEPSSGDDEHEDAESSALADETSHLAREVLTSTPTNLTEMLTKITEIESKIDKLQALVTELRQRSASISGMPSAIGLFSKLQDAINLASQVAGTVTIRGVKHTIETFEAVEPVNEMFTKRFQNLSNTNLITMIKHLHKDAREPTGAYGSKTVKEYKTLRDSEGDSEGTPKKDDTQEDTEEYRFISLIPTAPLSLGLPADKAFGSVLQDVTEQVKNKTYTFRTHDSTTYEESDTGNDIVFDMGDMGDAKETKPSYLEEAILRLSLEHLDVIYKYLLTTQNTTKGYVAILPCSVFGMKLSAKLLHYKEDSGEFSNSTGEENKKSINDLVDAYNVMGDQRKQLPHIAYIHTDNITFPLLNLERDSERVYSSNLHKTISTLSQLYVRFARASSEQPLVKIGLQDIIVGGAVIYDFPNFNSSYVYNAFGDMGGSTVVASEAGKKR